jgi:tetratricopeptide (TPR) repeat protein
MPTNIEPGPSDFDKELKRAVAAFNKGRFYEVESILYKVIWTMHVNADEHIQARTLLGNALRRMGRTAEAEKELRKALEIATAEGKAATRRDLMLSMGKIHFRKGDLDLANDFLKDAHDSAKEAKDELIQGKALIDMGNVQIMLGNYDVAEVRFQDGVRLIEKVGTKAELMRGLHNLAYVYFHNGNLKKAKEVLLRCVDLCSGAEPGICIYVFSDLAHTYLNLGELDKAEEVLKKAEEKLDRTDDKLGRLNLRWVQGLLMGARGDIDAALTVYDEIVPAIEDVGAQANVVEVVLDYIPLLIVARKKEQAHSSLEKAKAIVEQRTLGHFKKRISEVEELIKKSR